MTFRERVKQGLVLLDGAMGTEIQRFNPTPEEWDGKNGCSEVLNLTAPDKIQAIHERYYAAGSDVVETNTFGANILVLSEFDLQDRTEEINVIAATLARNAAAKYAADKPRFVAGSMGPGTKLASLGQTDYDTLFNSYAAQVRGLIRGGVDLFMVETCQDMLQIKAAINAIKSVQEEMKTDLPILVSVTIETTGTMLIGSEIDAAITSLSPLGIDFMGINCATGPDKMAPYIKKLSAQFQGPVMLMPNAGMPQNIDGEMVYEMQPKEFAAIMKPYITEEGVQIAGGCCGTTPEFIKELRIILEDESHKAITPAVRHPYTPVSVSSLFSPQLLHQEPGPLYIGERANTNGSRKFKDMLLKGDWDGIVDIAMQQERAGAHALDLCVAYTGRDEVADMKEALSRIAKQVTIPIVIDTTQLDVLEAALKLYGGRAIINSINLEDGEGRADKVCKLAKQYGAALIALTIDEQGMARTVERKVEIAKRIYDIAVNRHGLKAEDLIFDVLTFTLGSGDETMKDAGIKTLEGIRQVKAALPGVFTVLGLSNISFGLNPTSRRILNSVFLHEAVEAGLDTAIVDVSKIIPLSKIEQEDRDITLDLIYDRGDRILFKFIEHFDSKQGIFKEESQDDSGLPLVDRVKKRLIDGSKAGLEDLLMELMKEMGPIEIINNVLIVAMKVVGDLFGAGEMQLPFVLQSAEVMKFSVDKLEPYMEKKEESSLTSIVLATVQGDVHDIGKNLVDIILSNNGYKVYNIGIKCEIDTMIAKVKEVKADALGMSGLLVKSTIVMKENLEIMKRQNIELPVLLGGAALNRKYVDEVCDPILDSPVTYCEDAFAGLRVMSHIKDGTLAEAMAADRVKYASKKSKAPKQQLDKVIVTIDKDVPVPTPPFWGNKIVTGVDLDAVWEFVNTNALFKMRWGYKAGKQSYAEFFEMIEKVVQPEYEKLKDLIRTENLFEPQYIYGYYPTQSDGEELIVYKEDAKTEWMRIPFPRQNREGGRSIVDYYKSKDSGIMDMIGFQIVTIGPKADAYAHKLYAENRYKEYLLFHGLGVETAEALAEYSHKNIRVELGIADGDGKDVEELTRQIYQGCRYSFGYPACPELMENKKIFEVLQPQRIGVEMTETGLMVPEQTTSALIAHHKQARYFAV